MAWPGYRTARLASLLLLVKVVVLCSPVALSFVQLQAPSRYPASSAHCTARRHLSRGTVNAGSYDRSLPNAFDGDTAARKTCQSAGIVGGARRGPASRLWMSSPAPPVKPPKKRGWGGGGSGDDLYIRELLEPEKSQILTTWRSYAVADGGDKFAESIQIVNDMIGWRSGVIAARKRRFTLACCKGQAVQAVACVQIGPKNDAVRSFLAREACMSLCLLNVDPASPQFKAGAHLCKEIKEIGKLENMAVDFEPIKDIYSGRFYAATLTM